MSATSRSRLVNPLLGTYFGIFASLLAAVVLLLLVLEQLGIADATLRLSIIAGFLGLYCAVGIAAYTRLPAEYFASGRRVPAFFCGLNVALTALGGTGFAALSGALFLIGFDALCIGVGMGGLVCLAVLLVPYLRKFGAYSMPSYLGRRFDSATLRVVAAALLAVPTLLLLMAELKIAVAAASWLTQLSEGLVMAMLVATLALILTPGGMRSLTWSGAAAAMAAIGALMVPVVIVAVVTTNLPLPQLSYGPVLRSLMRTEAFQDIPAPLATALTFDLPGAEPEAVMRRFATPFSSIGGAAFVLAGFAVMMGIAGSPTLLTRAGTTPGVYEARKSMGWAAVVLGIVLLTLAGVSVFMRDIVVTQLGATAQGQPPGWFATLQGLGLAGVDAQAPASSLASYLFSRDKALIVLPVVAELPAVLVYLAAAGIVSAATVGACAAVTTLGTSLAEDVINAPRSELVSAGMRVMCARLGIVLAASAAGWMAAVTPGDPLDLFLWSLALAGSTAFPILVLSIWWKRATAWGMLAGLVVGFSVAAGAIMMGEISAFGLPGALAAIVAAPLNFAAVLVVSILPSPARRVLELVRDLRIPGGETLYDREVRLALLQSRQQP